MHMGEVLVSKCSSVIKCQLTQSVMAPWQGYWLPVTSYQLAHGQQPLCPILHIELHSDLGKTSCFVSKYKASGFVVSIQVKHLL